MYISSVHIRNFRRLKKCSLYFEPDKTILVGPNNSGKTSAIMAFKKFMKSNDSSRFTTRDFTLSVWDEINDKIGVEWEKTNQDEISEDTRSISSWIDFLPTFDIWIKPEDTEDYLLEDLMASLDENQDQYGLRIRFEPDIDELYHNFRRAFEEARIAKEKSKKGAKQPNMEEEVEGNDEKSDKMASESKDSATAIEETVIESGKESEKPKESTQSDEEEGTEFFPRNIHEYLERGNNLRDCFKLKFYALDPQKAFFDDINEYVFQDTEGYELEKNPIEYLVRLDFIYAHREFSDFQGEKDVAVDKLSELFQEFYKEIYDNEESLYREEDIPYIDGMKKARRIHNEKLTKNLSPLIELLHNLHYPGFHNPKIFIDSVIEIADTISTTSIQFEVPGSSNVKLYENYNGLGFRNLLAMCIKLYLFKEARCQPKRTKDHKDGILPPIHIVFIEEPEAHLHAQAQQVFINQVYDMLNPPKDKANKYKTQLVLSTHSNHIVNEISLDKIRFFKREEAGKLRISSIIDLKNVFGTDEETKNFVTRYIRLTHCDIYFADAVILVEGPAEKILMNHFLREGPVYLKRCYISVIEINGSHAHRFQSFLERLGVVTLIITDIDAQKLKSTKKTDSSEDKEVWEPAIPQKGKGYISNNDTLKKWWPKREAIDDLLDLEEDKKCNGNVRVAYQVGLNCEFEKGKKKTKCYPYTFEDALILTNYQLFKDNPVKGKGSLTTICNDIKKAKGIKAFHRTLFNRLMKIGGVAPIKKAELAVNLLYCEDFNKLCCPKYIEDGLKWVETQLKANQTVDSPLEKGEESTSVEEPSK